MNTYTTEDYRKYMYALGARDIRRTTAKVQRANLGNGDYYDIVELLKQAEIRLFLAAFCDGADVTARRNNSGAASDFGTYSDGRRVTTTIDWGHGYATRVAHPDPHQEETPQDRTELTDEVPPSCALEPPCLDPENDMEEEGFR